MKRVFSTGPKLITGLMLLLVTGVVMAQKHYSGNLCQRGRHSFRL